MFYKALNKKLVCNPPLTTAYLPTDLLNLPIHSAYKVWHHLVIFNKHHLHPSVASPHCFVSKPDASICLVTYPTKSFRRTKDLVLAKAVMYCKCHNVIRQAFRLVVCVHACFCKFFFCRASQRECRVLFKMFLQHDTVLKINIRFT